MWALRVHARDASPLALTLCTHRPQHNPALRSWRLMLGSLVLGPAVLIICVRGSRPLSASFPTLLGSTWMSLRLTIYTNEETCLPSSLKVNRSYCLALPSRVCHLPLVRPIARHSSWSALALRVSTSLYLTRCSYCIQAATQVRVSCWPMRVSGVHVSRISAWRSECNC